MNLFIVLFSFFVQPAQLTVTSPDFKNEGGIPVKCTCDGQEVNPALNVQGIPKGTKSLVVIMEDPDVPLSTFTHWVAWNIPPDVAIAANSVPGVQGFNSVGKNNYFGPCPPAGTHRYFFKVYALSMMLDLKAESTKSKVIQAMQGHILAQGELMGTYSRQRKM